MGLRIPYTFNIAPSAARTTAYTSPVISNTDGFDGVRVFISATDEADTPSVTFSIQIQDPISNQWASILTSAAVTGTTTNPLHLTVGPGVASVSNVALGTYIGRKFRVISTPGDSDSLTYSIHGEWLQTVGC